MKMRGIVKGQTIRFDHPIDLPEGQPVEVDIHPAAPSEPDPPELPPTPAAVDANVDHGHEAGAPHSGLGAYPPPSAKFLATFNMTAEEWAELEARIATEPEFENIRQADRLRAKIARQMGGVTNYSLQYIREDRDR